MSGPYETGSVILGEHAGTSALPDGTHAVVYYPRNERDHRVHVPNPLHVSSGPFPVLLYGHAYRAVATSAHALDRDFTTVGAMLSHVASHGCVCVAPDMSSLGNTFNPARAAALVICYAYLASLNSTHFANQLDLRRVIVCGHSRGARSATLGGAIIRDFSQPSVLAYGLIAPEEDGGSRAVTRPLLVLGGTLDTDQRANPRVAYSLGGRPKTLVMIPGANHYGYTDLCPPDNSCRSAVQFDNDGTISRETQQQIAAAYLAAWVRYFAHGDESVRPYLTGERVMEGFEDSGLQVQADWPKVDPSKWTPTQEIERHS